MNKFFLWCLPFNITFALRSKKKDLQTDNIYSFEFQKNIKLQGILLTKNWKTSLEVSIYRWNKIFYSYCVKLNWKKTNKYSEFQLHFLFVYKHSGVYYLCVFSYKNCISIILSMEISMKKIFAYIWLIFLFLLNYEKIAYFSEGFINEKFWKTTEVCISYIFTTFIINNIFFI